MREEGNAMLGGGGGGVARGFFSSELDEGQPSGLTLRRPQYLVHEALFKKNNFMELGHGRRVHAGKSWSFA